MKKIRLVTAIASIYAVAIAGFASANILHSFFGKQNKGENQFNSNVFQEFEDSLSSNSASSSIPSSTEPVGSLTSSSTSAESSAPESSSQEAQPGRSPYATTTVTYTRHDAVGQEEHPDQYDSRGYHVTYYTLDVKIKRITDFRTNLVLGPDGYPGDNVTDIVSNQVRTVESSLGVEVLGAISGDSGFSFTQRPGYVIRNSQVFRSTYRNNEDAQYEDLALWRDGTMSTYMEADYTVDQLSSMGIWQSWMFGPTLVKNGQINVTEDAEIVSGKASGGGNQRTVLGYLGPYHYWLMVSQGRTKGDRDGFSLYDLAQRAIEAGCSLAYNLDGGGSSTLVCQRDDGKDGKYKYPAEDKQRALGDMIYVVNA